MSSRYGVCGNPIRHSLSPWLHRYFAQITQRPINYAAYHVAQNGFSDFATQFFAQGGRGLNITLPFKGDALQLSDIQTSFSKQVRAANVLLYKNQKIQAFNTDGAGFIQDIKHYIRGGVKARDVLLLGAGGAARAVAFAIAKEQPNAFFIYNRTLHKASSLADDCGAKSLADLDKNTSYDIIINASAAGHTSSAMTFPPTLFRSTKIAYDLSYGKAAHAFLSTAGQMGAHKTVDGIGMLARQAALSFAIWQGVLPPTTNAIDFLQNA